jgi:hypothetical protein
MPALGESCRPVDSNNARILEMAEDAELESRIHSKQEALELVKSTFGSPNRVP